MKGNPLHNLSPAKARLVFFALFTVVLTWGMAAGHLVLESYAWLSPQSQYLNNLLANFAAYQPLLLEQGFALSKLSYALIVILSCLPVLLSALELFMIGLFFLRLSKGEIWSNRNTDVLLIAGILSAISPMAYSVVETLQSLAISVSLPKGERIFVYYVGMSFDAAYDIIKGVILISLSLIIKESKNIKDEQDLYI